MKRLGQSQALMFSVGLSAVVEGSFTIGATAFFIRTLGSVSAADAAGGVFWLAMTVAELPTGYITDAVGPKRAMLLSVFLRAVAFAVFFFGARTSGLLFLANAIAGVALTLSTGAIGTQLKLDDRRRNAETNMRAFSANASTARYAGTVIGGILGFVAIRAAGIIWIWIPAILVSAVLLVQLAATWSDLRGNAHRDPVQQVARGFRELLNDRDLLRCVGMIAAIFLTSLSVEENWIPEFIPRLDKAPVLLTTSVLLMMFLRTVLSTTWARLPKLQSTSPRLALGAFGASAALAGILPLWWNAGFFVIALFAATGAMISANSLFLRRLPADAGGVVSSAAGVVYNASGTVALFLTAFIVGKSSIAASWVIAGTVAVLFSVIVGPTRDAINTEDRDRVA